ncbi:hypothetical protein [Rhizobium subbaraonis]|uniref:hypothetical protein n=1 Tax=Rhizobium subbaraonis TaxID=908946 RepID=UPI001596D081|nr:hypothetical protein [Rhizobium subbaraonis]
MNKVSHVPVARHTDNPDRFRNTLQVFVRQSSDQWRHSVHLFLWRSSASAL